MPFHDMSLQLFDHRFPRYMRLLRKHSRIWFVNIDSYSRYKYYCSPGIKSRLPAASLWTCWLMIGCRLRCRMSMARIDTKRNSTKAQKLQYNRLKQGKRVILISYLSAPRLFQKESSKLLLQKLNATQRIFPMGILDWVKTAADYVRSATGGSRSESFSSPRHPKNAASQQASPDHPLSDYAHLKP